MSNFAKIAFTPRVQHEQRRFGTSEAYSHMLSADSDTNGMELTAREAAFLSAADGFFQATVSETGWPYVQFRGGAPGFLNVINSREVGYADLRGNRQYISVGNLRDDDRVSIIAVDYARQKRLKILGRARITENPAFIADLQRDERFKAERAIIVRVTAFDWNCPKHIPVRLTAEEYGEEIAELKAEISSLQRKLQRVGTIRDNGQTRQ